jgi:hypothetical protein
MQAGRGKGLPKSPLVRQCQRACLLVLLQCMLSVALVLACVWVATLFVRQFEIIGITSIPPGLLHETTPRDE